MNKNNKVTACDAAYREIRSSIISGSYWSGERLIEVDIAKKLGLSRTPVREALKHLEKDGFLVREPYKGMMVKDFSPAEVKNYYQVRAILEALCGFLAAQNATEEIKNQLLQCIVRSKEALAGNDLSGLARLNDELHEYLICSTGNDLLKGMLENLRSYAAIMRISLMTLPSRPQTVIDEHEKIVDAVVKGKKVLAGKFALNHMRSSWRKAKEMKNY